MKRLDVYVDEDFLDDLRVLAKRSGTSMSELARYALDKTFEDQLDVIAAERALEEARRDPSSTMSLEEYEARRAHGVREVL